MRRVVVTGLGAVTPIGNNMNEYWNGLVNGVNGIAPITRFDTTDSKCKLAAEVKNFDPSAVLDKGTARKTDLYTQYALVSAEEAMQDSGLLGNIAEDELGVYFGSGVGGIETTIENHAGILAGGPKKVSPQFVPKMIINIAAGQIAIRFNAHGNAMCMSTACATGTTAIGEAYRAIKDGYLTAAICGGSESSVNPLCVAGFINCMALSQATDPNEASLPFDSRRAGFVLGEGAATLILEEYEHAVARGAKIYAEICGYGATCDAYHITSPAEDGSGAAMAMTQAMKEAGVEPSQVAYVNAHGTSTHHNDLFETRAIKLAFGDAAKNLYVNSTKSMIGHLLGAAGAVECIICAKSVMEDYIHPTVNSKEADEECDLNYVFGKGVHTEVEYALSNSLGFGGHNASLLIAKYRE